MVGAVFRRRSAQVDQILVRDEGIQISSVAGQAARRAPALSIQDPIRVGLVTNVHRPGGNITGVSILINEMEPKRLELLGELRPQA